MQTAQPLRPAELGGPGVWPRPRLAKRVTTLGLTATQWAYVAVVYLLWDVGRQLGRDAVLPALAAVPFGPTWWPWQGELGWAAGCALLAAGLALFTWHGLHAAQLAERWWRDATEPRLAVWRPLPLEWEEETEDDAGEPDAAERPRAAAGDPPPPSAANPLGWVVE